MGEAREAWRGGGGGRKSSGWEVEDVLGRSRKDGEPRENTPLSHCNETHRM